MKKLLIVLVLVFIAGSVFASNNSTYCKVIEALESEKISKLDFVAQNAKDIRTLEFHVAYEVYQDQKVSAFWPFVINSSLGCGIGSFMQGDNLTGWIGLAGDVIGTSLLVSGLTSYASQSYQIQTDPYGNPVQVVSPQNNDNSDMLILSGVIVLSASRVYQLLRPFFYANKYNKQLRKALFSDNTSLAVVPYTQKGDSMGMAMVGTVRF